MLSREVTTTGVHVVDDAGHACEVRAAAFAPATPANEFDVPTDAAAAGTTTEFRVDAPTALVRSTSGPDRRLGDGSDARLSGGPHVVEATGAVGVLARFDAPARVSVDDGTVTVSFDDAVRVELGFLGRATAPAATVAVPDTPTGVAAAVTAMSAAHRTTGPRRSRPTMRRHPPRLEWGEAVRIPDSVAADVPETGIRVTVPDGLESVLSVAPLAYYLGATVDVTDDDVPRVVAPEGDVDEPLGGDEAAARVLERAFWLDALAASDDGRDRLDALDVDPDAVTTASPAERLGAAVDAPFDRVSLPEWPLALYVEPTPAYARALPGVLDRLAHVHPAETTPLGGRELVERTLDDFYRTTPGPIATVEMENPRLRRGRTHGWLADGTPIDVFKALPEAYDGYDGSGGGESVSVTVVLNDPGMSRERDRVAALYREHADDAPLDVTLHADLTRADLAEVFAADTDFVHYIGHCEADGLLCADGALSTASIDDVGARTFFLNACGSYYEGLDLVRGGSAAGAVTVRKVLDEHAARVGTAFARLLVAGFTVDRAMTLARRRIVMGKDYVVVGDGTRTLSKGGTPSSGVFTVDRVGGAYEVAYEAGTAWTHGDRYQSPLPDGGVRLAGAESSATLDGATLSRVLANADAPVVFDGEFCWADDALARLEREQF